jgi:hypothetical protein
MAMRSGYISVSDKHRAGAGIIDHKPETKILCTNKLYFTKVILPLFCKLLEAGE